MQFDANAITLPTGKIALDIQSPNPDRMVKVFLEADNKLPITRLF